MLFGSVLKCFDKSVIRCLYDTTIFFKYVIFCGSVKIIVSIMGNIDQIKTLRLIRDCFSMKDFDRLSKSIGLVDADYNLDARISGLDNEDSFAETCRLMGTATHIIQLSHNPKFCKEYKVPDFFIRFQPNISCFDGEQKDILGKNILVEVKSTNKSKAKVSGEYLRMLRKTSDMMGYPLCIAIRFNTHFTRPFWVIKLDDNREKNNITFSEDEIDSCMRVILWDDYNFFIHEDTNISLFYDKSKVTSAYAVHPEFGSLEKVLIKRGENSVVFAGEDRLVAHLFLESFELKQIGVQTFGANTTQYLKPGFYVPSLSDVLFFMNNYIQRFVIERNERYDRFPFIFDDSIFSRNSINDMIAPLIDKNLLYKYVPYEPDDQLKIWEKYFGSRV